MAGAGDCQRPTAPGMKYRHYAPKGQLILVSNWREAEALRQSMLAQDPEPPLLMLGQESVELLQAAGIPAACVLFDFRPRESLAPKTLHRRGKSPLLFSRLLSKPGGF